MKNKYHNYYVGSGLIPKPASKTKCANCGEFIDFSKRTSHVVVCYRNPARCEICGERVQSSMKMQHLAEWQSEKMLIECIQEDDDEEFNLALDHGVDSNHEIKGETLLHICAKYNAIECALALIRRGAKIDTIDRSGYTPLLIAIENNNKLSTTLMELGASIECK